MNSSKPMRDDLSATSKSGFNFGFGLSTNPALKFDVSTQINRILLWVRNQRMSSADAFHSLLTDIYGLEADNNSRLTFENFLKVIRKLELNMLNVNVSRLAISHLTVIFVGQEAVQCYR